MHERGFQEPLDKVDDDEVPNGSTVSYIRPPAGTSSQLQGRGHKVAPDLRRQMQEERVQERHADLGRQSETEGAVSRPSSTSTSPDTYVFPEV